MVTVRVLIAESGEKEDRIKGGAKMNPVVVPVPFGLVTTISPLAPAPTTAVILVGETTVNELAGTPPKLTFVIPVKRTPVMVTVPPCACTEGVKEVTAGIEIKLKPFIPLVPTVVVTRMVPLAPAPTTAVIIVSERTVKEVAGVPAKLTAVVPERFLPFRVTVPPVYIAAGVNSFNSGNCMIELDTQLDAVPESAKLPSVPLLLLDVRSKSVVIPVLVAPALP